MEAPAKGALLEAHERRWVSAWVWLTYAAVYFLVQGLLAWTIASEGPWWAAAGMIGLLVHVMHVHTLALHEASHETLCPSRWWNDAMGLFIGGHAFLPLALYRAAHYFHHAYLATERDDELWPFVIPGTPRWARRLAAAVELTFGLVYTPGLFLRSFLRSDSPIQDPKVRRRIWLELGVIAAAWTVVLAVTAWFDLWVYLLVLYVIPAGLAADVQSLRKYVEHMGLLGSSVLGSTRSVVPASRWGRLAQFSMFNIAYHGVHHTYARMHSAAMPEFVAVLEPTDDGEKPPFPTYLHACWDMIQSLSDPRVGAQWLAERDEVPGRPRVRIGRPQPRRSALAS